MEEDINFNYEITYDYTFSKYDMKADIPFTCNYPVESYECYLFGKLLQYTLTSRITYDDDEKLSGVLTLCGWYSSGSRFDNLITVIVYIDVNGETYSKEFDVNIVTFGGYLS